MPIVFPACLYPSGLLTMSVAPTASSRLKTSEGKSLCACFSIRLPPTVPTLRTFVLATWNTGVIKRIILI